MTRIFTVPLYVNVAAGAEGNDSSLPLNNLSLIIGAYLSFPPGTGNLVQVRFFEAAAQPQNAIGPPGGLELTRYQKQTGIYAADGCILPIVWQKKPEDTSTVIAMDVLNNSGQTFAIYAGVIVSL